MRDRLKGEEGKNSNWPRPMRRNIEWLAAGSVGLLTVMLILQTWLIFDREQSQQYFRTLVADPIPGAIGQLKGGGVAWPGRRVLVFFSLSEPIESFDFLKTWTPVPLKLPEERHACPAEEAFRWGTEQAAKKGIKAQTAYKAQVTEGLKGEAMKGHKYLFVDHEQGKALLYICNDEEDVGKSDFLGSRDDPLRCCWEAL